MKVYQGDRMIVIPFSGSKRNSYKDVRYIVETYKYKKVFEPFGGSCVLSVNLYNDGLVEEAVINDYDGLFDTYEEFLDVKDWVVKECFKRGLYRMNADSKGNYRLIDGKKHYTDSMLLDADERKILQGVIKEVDPKWWRLLSLGTNFCHSIVHTHKSVNLGDFCLFNRHLETDVQRAYLNIVRKMERYSLDWHEFIEKLRDRFDNETLIIADPPYSGSSQCQYKSEFDADTTIELLDTLLSTGCDFIFFHCDWELVSNWLKENGIINFDVIVKRKGCNAENPALKREEFMVHVKRG